ncbi:M81 family metallopeptidase [Roseibium sediminicola]|uniref:Microcystinase C n=1 Tax=Roseibium sediminicola TaxID=2933272 RepID=A0ABT0GQ59_9HYPH|nr:M81 family metallopeptidase [Roseibium sp. CAU 1639]MCK7611574.1 M81 family metallopeptidase [Roseibium sp. CAU 1639]
MKIAVGGIHTECSTYSTLFQTADDFTLARGPDLLEQCGLAGDGFAGVSFCPLFHARAIPGGPVDPDCYEGFKTAFLQELRAAMPVDGVLLIMHGAMYVPDLADPEGDWIAAVREVVGADAPIAVSYDLHGNVTQDTVDQIDIFCAYRTAPHIDVRETHLRAARLLVDQLQGGPRRMVAWAPVPVLLPGEKTSTEDAPAKALYESLPELDLRAGICDTNLMVGYVWADVARATAAAVVTGTDPDALLKAAADIATSYWNVRDLFDFGVSTKSLAQCLDDAAAATSHPLILADSGDNPTGGGVGDRNDVLKAWLKRGLRGAVFAGIADPPALAEAWRCAEGSSLDLTIGGALGSPCSPVTVSAVVQVKIGETTKANREVLVEIDGNQVVLTERRRPFHTLADFRKFGVEPERSPFLIVKSGYLSPELAPLANPALMALTEGAVNQDIASLANSHRRQPTYPFKDAFDWQARPTLSRRARQK